MGAIFWNLFGFTSQPGTYHHHASTFGALEQQRLGFGMDHQRFASNMANDPGYLLQQARLAQSAVPDAVRDAAMNAAMTNVYGESCNGCGAGRAPSRMGRCDYCGRA